ncbi:MAG TPA: AmmeMemoRadiSam system protein B [Candidatus Magasanikbacteria bacterium]|nr:AmmeMemoRadiSam system protein B [Candidatus Magasanikbacteria bacterium]
MSLAFAAITPHPPICLPSIGGNDLVKVQATRTALARLEQDLYIEKPDIIVVISPHGGIFRDVFTLNGYTEFTADFTEFGDMVTTHKWAGATNFASIFYNHNSAKEVPMQLIADPKLDHGAAIPLMFLTDHLQAVKILPVGYSELSPLAHLAFGEALKDMIMESDARVAVIASGDLSHALTSDSPAGFNAAGAEFDQQLIKMLETRNTVGIAQMNQELVKNAAECGYRSILILLGVLKNMNYSFENYAYEAPFGVGYLTGNFVLN